MSTVSRWRLHSRKVIQAVIAREGTGDLDALQKAISAAYPFGERRYYPYKVWLQEVRIALGNAGRPPAEQGPLFEAHP